MQITGNWSSTIIFFTKIYKSGEYQHTH